MAHQFSSGVFCYNKPAWHRLGVVVDGTLSAREAFRIAKADFHVSGRQVFDADMQPIAGYQAITRIDTGRTLSVMTETYTPIQNDSLIRIAEALHEEINMDAVCVLSDAKKVTFTARIRGAEGDVVPGDPVQQYLVGCTSHDASIPFQLMFSPVRVVCHNTLSAALGMASSQRHRDSSIRIRHTKNADSLLARLPELVDVRRRQFIDGLDELRHMAATPCSMAQFRQYISKVYADQLHGAVNNIRGDKSTTRPKMLEDLSAWSSILRKFEGDAIGSELPSCAGTMWGAYQCATEYITHGNNDNRNKADEARKRYESVYWGARAKTLANAHRYALTA